MKSKKLYTIGCAVGGVLVGFFAGELNSVLGAILFTVGVTLITVCVYKLTKSNTDN